MWPFEIGFRDTTDQNSGLVTRSYYVPDQSFLAGWKHGWMVGWMYEWMPAVKVCFYNASVFDLAQNCIVLI